LLNTYYRKTADYSIEAINSSNNALKTLYLFSEKIKALKQLKLFGKIKFTNTKTNDPTLEKYYEDFMNALNDDLNTPKALEIV